MPHLLQQAVELCYLAVGQADVGEHLLVQDLCRPFDGSPAGPGDDRQGRPAVGGMTLALDQSLGLQAVDCARDARGMDLQADAELAERQLTVPREREQTQQLEAREREVERGQLLPPVRAAPAGPA